VPPHQQRAAQTAQQQAQATRARRPDHQRPADAAVLRGAAAAPPPVSSPRLDQFRGRGRGRGTSGITSSLALGGLVRGRGSAGGRQGQQTGVAQEGVAARVQTHQAAGVPELERSDPDQPSRELHAHTS
jgi:hypothetical protein